MTALSRTWAGGGEGRWGRALRHSVGVLTTVAGVAGTLLAAAILATKGEAPEPLDTLLLTPGLSVPAVLALSIAAVIGGVLWLRGSAAGAVLCSGTWSFLAALAARPDFQFNYAAGGLPEVALPAHGGDGVVVALFAFAALFAVLAHASPSASGQVQARAESTASEMLAGTFFLTSGLVVAIRFQADAAAFGRPAYEHALIVSLVAAVVCQAIGLGLLLGFLAARAVAIVVLLTVVASALVPDLLFDRLDVPLPLFWGTVCALTAAGLLVPRRLRA